MWKYTALRGTPETIAEVFNDVEHLHANGSDIEVVFTHAPGNTSSLTLVYRHRPTAKA